MRRLASVLCGLGAALAPLAAQKTIVVDDSGGADFIDVQPAINAANPGDVIRIRHGVYGSAVIDKGIRLLGDPRGSDAVDFVYLEDLTVSGITRDHIFVATGIQTTTVSVTDSPGSVYLSHVIGRYIIVRAEHVSLERCIAVAGFGFAATILDSYVIDARGVYLGVLGAALRLERSDLTLVDTLFAGGLFASNGLPISDVTDSHVLFSENSKIFTGSFPPSPGYVLKGNNTADQALHSILVDQLGVPDRMRVSMDSGYLAPWVMVAFSDATRPTRTPWGIFHLELPSTQLLYSNISAVNAPRFKFIEVPMDFDANNRWLGIPVTVQAAVWDFEGNLTLSLPYTTVF
ncbi:MAG: hypothetical protein ACYTG5_14260 [Planctomycetota bacterium]|jgi:hypothetical protein